MQKLGKRYFPIILVLPCIVYLLCITIFPLIYSLYLSFHSWDLAQPARGVVFVGLENYTSILGKDKRFWDTLVNTLTILTGAISIEVLLGLGLALLMNRKIKGAGIIKTLMIVPIFVTPIVVGAIGRMLFYELFGPINYLLHLSIGTTYNWLTDPLLARITVILLDIWQWTPFTFLILLAGVQNLPLEPFEAAKIDGASRWMIFKSLTFPLLKPLIIVILLIRAMDLFKLFDPIWLLTYGGPGIATETSTFYTYFTGFTYWRIGYTAALSWLGLFIIIIISQLLIKSIRR